MLGFLLVNKPAGISSHDAIYAVRRKLQVKRVGHAGTLDPLASGLLVVAVGPATRYLQYLALEPKVYEATVLFGLATTTYDSEGESLGTPCPPPLNLKQEIEKVIPQYLGLIEQTPPQFSAIKIKGQPAYKYARAGETVEIASRKVLIEKIKLLDLDGDACTIEVTCSGGTYIRTLAHDFGVTLGCGAHLTALKRTQIGSYQLANAVELDAITPDDLITMQAGLAHLQSRPLHLNEAQLIQTGQKVANPDAIQDGIKVVLVNKDGNFIGIGRVEQEWIYPECILPNSVASSHL